ncbi:hypothetical protein V1523DRAFT_420107 [Lipomyces doorenjongii]
MPARSKRSKANQKISRKKYRVDPEVDVEELNKALDNHDFAEDETQVEYDGTESETQSPMQSCTVGIRSLFEYNFTSSKEDTDSIDRAIYTGMLSAIVFRTRHMMMTQNWSRDDRDACGDSECGISMSGGVSRSCGESVPFHR